MKDKNNVKSGIIITVLLCIISIFLFGLSLNYFQNRIALEDIEAEMISDSAKVREYYSEAEFVRDSILYSNDQYIEGALELMLYQASYDSSFKMSDQYMQELQKTLDVYNVMIIDRDGKIKASAIPAGKSLGDMLEPSDCSSLYEAFVTGRMTAVTVPCMTDTTELEYLISLAETREMFAEAAGYPARSETGSDVVAESGSAAESADESGSGAKGVNASTEVSGEDFTETADEQEQTDRSFMMQDTNLYALPIDEKYAFVIEDRNLVNQYFLEQMEPWNYVLKDEVIGTGGFVFVWSAENNQILYYPEPELKGENVSVLGMDLEKIVDGRFVWQKVNDTQMYLYPVFDSEKKAWVVCACEKNLIFRMRRIVSLAILIIFGIFALVLAYYGILHLKSEEIVTEKSAYTVEGVPHFRNRKVRYLIFTLFAAVVMFLGSFYLQTLYEMSDWAKRGEKTIQAAKEVLLERDAFAEYYPGEYERQVQSLAKMIARFLEKNPDRLTITTLNELTEILNLAKLEVSDQDNNVLAVSSEGLTGSEVKSGEEITEGDGAESWGTDQSYVLATSKVSSVLSDSDDHIMGTLTLTYYTAIKNGIMESQSVNSALRRVQPGEGSFLFCVNKETGQITSHPQTENIGKSAEEYGLNKKYILENLCAMVTINRTAYYMLSGSGSSDIFYVAIREQDLLKHRLLISIWAVIAAFVLLSLIGLAVYLQEEPVSHVIRERNRSERLMRNTPESRAFGMLFLFAIAAAAVVALYSLLNNSGDTGSVLDYVMSGNWEPGFNAFALTSSLVTICRGCIVIFLVRQMAFLMAGILPIRVGTIIRMFTSLFSYLGAFLILYSCSIDFGLPATALMASAGVISVVLGIGANSLVGDIIAGMFLLTEGHVQVGDAIEVDGFTGVVQELGIRVTTLYDSPNNTVKIIPNREVQNVIHRSMLPAYILNVFQIEYEEDIGRVETLLKEELKNMTGQIKGMIGEPEYLGLEDLQNSGVLLKVRIKGHEMDRYDLSREVNRRIYLMFVRNNITIPYPHVTLDQ